MYFFPLFIPLLFCIQGDRLNEIRSENEGGTFFHGTVNFRFQFSRQTNALCRFLATHATTCDQPVLVIHSEIAFFFFSCLHPRITLSFYLRVGDKSIGRLLLSELELELWYMTWWELLFLKICTCWLLRLKILLGDVLMRFSELYWNRNFIWIYLSKMFDSFFLILLLKIFNNSFHFFKVKFLHEMKISVFVLTMAIE